MATGLSLSLYTTKQELDNAKAGVSTIVAWTGDKKPENAIYEVNANLEICDVLDTEVRVNVSKAQDELKKVAEIMGTVMGTELEKVLKQFTE